MHKWLIGLFGFCVAIGVQAAPSLEGRWRSDHDRTMAFARDHARLRDSTYLFLDQILGRLTLRFDGSHIVSEMPESDIRIAGKLRHMEALKEEGTYEVLFSNDKIVVVKGRDTETGKFGVKVYNFIDDDTMWVYQDSADNEIADLNIREYFVRVK